MSEKNDIQKLLKLKSYEMPSADYFERFVEEFQRRQRRELLKRSAWQTTLDRVQSFFEFPAFGKLAYSGVAALLLVAGIAAFELGHQSPVAVSGSQNFVADNTAILAPQQQIPPQQKIYVSAPAMSMNMASEQIPVGLSLLTPAGSNESFTIGQSAVIQNRPAINDSSKTFSF